jgi:hypothetical protein
MMFLNARLDEWFYSCGLAEKLQWQYEAARCVWNRFSKQLNNEWASW